MTEQIICDYITATFPDAQIVPNNGNVFFFHGPDRKLPFATLVITDEFDPFSDLQRPGIFRVNIGISKATYLEKFSPPPAGPFGETPPDPSFNYTALDTLLPHPVYFQMFWVAILNPSEATFQQTVQPLLREAYDCAAARNRSV